MPGFFERFGRAAQQKANEGKLLLDIRGIGSKLDERAQALGHLMFRRHNGESIADEELVSILREMDQAVAERKVKEAELVSVRQPAVASPPAAASAPAPAAAPAPEAAPTPAPTSEATPIEAPAAEKPAEAV